MHKRSCKRLCTFKIHSDDEAVLKAISEMENVLIVWMEDQIKKCPLLNYMMVQAKTRSLFIAVKREYSDPSAKFVATQGWLSRFKACANLYSVKVSGETADADTKAAQMYPEVLRKIIECGCTTQLIFSVDETWLFWKKLPNRTYISNEVKTMLGFKAAKSGLMLLVEADVEDDCKLKPLLVCHSENPCVFKGLSKATLPVHFHSNPKSWRTVVLSEYWFKNSFIPKVEKFCRGNNILFQDSPIVSNASGHPAHLDGIHTNAEVEFLPPNTTLILQPMNQGLFANFKADFLRKHLHRQ
jgi:hypothetical protein